MRIATLPLLIALLSGAGAATAGGADSSSTAANAAAPSPAPDSAPPRPHVIIPPMLTERPMAEDIQRFYPRPAQRAGISNRTTIHCLVAIDGKLVDCEILKEDPPGWGFGDATLKMVKIFKLKAKTDDGVPVPGGVFQTIMVWHAHL